MQVHFRYVVSTKNTNTIKSLFTGHHKCIIDTNCIIKILTILCNDLFYTENTKYLILTYKTTNST